MTDQQPRRYVVRMIGHNGQLIGHRYVLTYQVVDRIAAVTVPQSEALRLFGETGGNTAAVLAPIAEALREKGYDTLMVLPAQSQLVELSEVGTGGPIAGYTELFDEARRLELESAKLLAECAATLIEVSWLHKPSDGAQSAALAVRLRDLANRCAQAYVRKG